MNLLRNPSFEEGWTDYNESIQTPNDWTVWWADCDVPNPHDDAEHSQFCPPELVHKNRSQLPEHEQDVFVLNGEWTFKIFKGSGSWYARLSQVVDLAAGNYKLIMPIFADLVKSYVDGAKIWADDPQGRDGLVRFIVDGSDGDWQSLEPGEWNFAALDFHAAGETEIAVEIMCPFPLDNAGIFADAWILAADDTPDPPECRGLPRVDYARTVNVIPNTVTDEQAAAVFMEGWQRGRETAGASYDDAMIGDLSSRQANLYGIPPEQQADFIAFRDEHYPGALVSFRDLPGDAPDPPPAVFTRTTLHLQAGVYGWPEYVRQVKPAWVKGFWAEGGRDVKAVSPGTKYLWRHHFYDYDQFRDDPKPEEAAKRFLDHFWPAVANDPTVGAVEGQNEDCESDRPDFIERAARFAIALSNEVSQRSVALGRHVALVALNPPIANIEADQVPLLYDLVRTLNRNGHYFGAHTYYPVCSDFERSRRWLETEGFWWHLRPVLMWDARFRGAGITPPRYLFTESGPCGTSVREDGRPGSMMAASGWRGNDALCGNFDHYLELQARYEEMLAEYPNVEACMNFTSGGGQKWASFELGGDEWARLARALK